MKKNAKWTVYLQPNWNYDVSVTMGSQENSIYNLNVTSGSGAYPLARYFSSSKYSHFFIFDLIPFLFLYFKNSNLALGVNQYVEKTQRVTTGSDGKIVLQEVFFFDFFFFFLF